MKDFVAKLRYRAVELLASSMKWVLIFAAICFGVYGMFGPGSEIWFTGYAEDDQGMVSAVSLVAAIFLAAVGFLFKDAFMSVHADEG